MPIRERTVIRTRIAVLASFAAGNDPVERPGTMPGRSHSRDYAVELPDIDRGLERAYSAEAMANAVNAAMSPIKGL